MFTDHEPEDEKREDGEDSPFEAALPASLADPAHGPAQPLGEPHTEHSLLPHAVLESALATALEAIAVPAFLFGEDGLVRRANQASIPYFVHDSRELLESIADDPTRAVRDLKLRGREARYTVTRLSRIMAPCMYLAVGRTGESTDVQTRLEVLGDRWQLSGRQRDTLELLVQGLPNKAIALRLGIAVGTVEIHVSKVLRQAGVDSRAALAARFFNDSLD